MSEGKAPVEGGLGTLTNPEIQRCPFDFFNKVQSDAPVYHDPGTGMYMITRYDDIAYVADHPELFSSNTGVIFDRSTSPVAAEIRHRFETHGVLEAALLNADDPPRHTKHRALVSPAFSPAAIKRLEPKIQQMADDLIDAFIERGTVDIRAEFGVMLPAFIMADYFGIERKDYGKFVRWAAASLERIDPTNSPEKELALVDEIIDLQNYVLEAAARYRKEPADNFLSTLANGEVDGVRLTDSELASLVQQILLAGTETTGNAIPAGMYVLMKDPVLLKRLQDDPKLIPNFVEEVIRTNLSVLTLFRKATSDTQIAGYDVPEGAIVQASFLAANRDPAKWERPADFDIDRKDLRRHLGFGRGIHTCLGNTLARADMRIAFERLLTRLKDVRLSSAHPEPEFEATFQIRSLPELYLDFTPGPRLG
ncbi:cytochrome P450 [Novosphingobium naphthalenivorans]|uniref:cytochrome P450 n=1 Tax=Novosphingobium naphthalenivorans TaxID=273168 RepID=UPI00082B9744|nr:cytochrome P450 [Novosphingobium naphthalenivorans]